MELAQSFAARERRGGAANPALAEAVARSVAMGAQVRLLLGIPVAMGVGIVTYFALPAEPAGWVGAAVALTAVLGALLVRQAPLPRLCLALLAAAGFGFACAHARTALLPPRADIPTRAVIVNATVAAVEHLPEGRRVRLTTVRLGDDQALLGRDVRVRIRANDSAALAPGDAVRVRALLRAPAPPAMPGAFDFQRHAYFAGLGAVGTALGPVELLASPQEATRAVALQRLRERVITRVTAAVPGQEGAIAAALLTGTRSAIAPDKMAAIRDSGLAHLLSVSGLHVGIVAGVVFATVRLLLALSGAALFVHGKKIGAVAGILAGLGYMLLTGSQVPMQRAVTMAALFTLGVLLDRTGVGLRALAFAAIVVLVLQPETLLGPSFQMSFAAVLGLIAAYHAGRPWLSRVRAARGPLARFGAAVLLLAFTSLVASAATAPFAAWHFQRVQIYGIAANAFAVPLTSVAIMPLGMLGLVLMPLELEAVALAPMGWGVSLLLATAHTVAAWPGAAPIIPAAPVWGVVAVTAGVLLLCLWRGRAALLGVIPVLAGLASPWMVQPPDIVVSPRADLIVLRAADGFAVQALRGASRFERDMITAMLGQRALTPVASGDDGVLACDAGHCTLTGPDGGKAVLLRPSPVDAACADAALAVSSEPLRGRCRPAPMIDRFSVWRDGAHAAWLRPDGGVRIVSDRALRGARPWVTPEPVARQGRPSSQPLAETLELE